MYFEDVCQLDHCAEPYVLFPCFNRTGKGPSHSGRVCQLFLCPAMLITELDDSLSKSPSDFSRFVHKIEVLHAVLIIGHNCAAHLRYLWAVGKMGPGADSPETAVSILPIGERRWVGWQKPSINSLIRLRRS